MKVPFGYIAAHEIRELRCKRRNCAFKRPHQIDRVAHGVGIDLGPDDARLVSIAIGDALWDFMFSALRTVAETMGTD